MRVANSAREWRLDFAQTMDTLQALAESILARIKTLDDARSTLARSRWQARGELDALSRLEVATGLGAEVLEQVWPRPFTGADPLPYSLKAAARMIGSALEPAALKALLADIEAIPGGPDPAALEKPRRLAAEVLRDHQDDTPFLQGYRLAQGIREYLGQADGRLDPEALLGDWGIDLRGRDLGSDRLDAIAVWGQGHQPTVMVNRTGLRSRLPTGRRTTCAHELCHLLVDTDDALPAVEVLGGNVPQPVEQRANAFAAELLLPLDAAGRAVESELAHVHTPDARRQAIKHALQRLHRHYDVSFETAAWQVKNSGRLAQANEDALQPYLKSLWAPF
jgi:hypothetical protein